MKPTLGLAAIVFVVLGLGLVGTTAADGSTPDCTDVEYAGDGNSENPYEITDADELQCLGDGDTDLDDHFELQNDIDLSDAGVEDWNGGDGFEPIAASDKGSATSGTSDGFVGTFDGNGYTISGLEIDRGDDENVGLFGLVGDGGEVSDVILENVNVTGGENVGGLVGMSTGDVSHSRVTGEVWATDAADPETTSYGVEVGGLVGRLDGDSTETGTISHSSAAVNVTAESGERAGGLVGAVARDKDETVVTHSFATGNVTGVTDVGGLAGMNNGEITDSYATGAVTGDERVGGLVGRNTDTDTSHITRSYSTGVVDGSTNDGGLVGNNEDSEPIDSYWDTEASGTGDSDGGEGLTTSEMTGESADSEMDGFDFDETWTIEVAPDSYPYLRDNPQSPPPYVNPIEDWYDLDEVRNDLDGEYVLVADLDDDAAGYDELVADPIEGWDPIGTRSDGFAGHFYGNGHTISGLTIDREEIDVNGTGLFDTLAAGSNVSDLGIEDVEITGGDRVGGLAGNARSATVTNVYTTGEITAIEEAGGLIGIANHGTSSSSTTITESHSTATVTVSEKIAGGLVGTGFSPVNISASYATGDVSGGDRVGGLFGDFSQYDPMHRIAVSYATGDVTGSDAVGGLVGDQRDSGHIEQSYAVGAVSGETDVGGLVGRSESSESIENSYWDTDASGTVDSDGGEGLTTSEMTGESAESEMDGFDFADIWTYETDPDTYPFLQANPQDPVLRVIENWHDLDAVRNDLDGEYVLVADLNEDTPGYDEHVADPEEGWEPIGNDTNRFEGEFDGNNHTISRIDIERNESHVGLFGFIGSDGVVSSVGIEDSTITIGTDDGSNESAGLLAGRSHGTITGAYSMGSVDGDRVVGGLVGWHSDGGVINESYSTADVIAGEEYVGGLTGFTSTGAEIHRSYATGSVEGPDGVGGLVGYLNRDDALITQSYAVGEVSGESRVGGLVGRVADSPSVENSYWDTETSGQSESDRGTGLTTDEMTGSDAESNMSGFDFIETWAYETDPADTYPYLQANPQTPPPGSIYAGGEGTEESPYEIENWYHLDNVRENLDADFVLVDDLHEYTEGYGAVASETANDGQGFEPIGEEGEEFTGTFSGDGHLIEGLTIERPEERHVGLFGYAKTSDVKIENVRLESADVHGEAVVGGLGGRIRDGTVENASVSGTVVAGNQAVGGLVGQPVDADLTNQLAATGTVEGKGKTEDVASNRVGIGGLVGRSSGNSDISVAYTNSTVIGENAGGIIGSTSGNPSTFRDMYSASVVDDGGTGTAVGAVAGIVESSGDEFKDSVYWDTELESEAVGAEDASGWTGDFVGLETAKMQGASAEENMDEFDWESTWQVVPGGYPVFQWEAAAADTVEITGTVTDALDDEPLEGATVESSVDETTTDSDGNFELGVSIFGDQVTTTATVDEGFTITNTSEIEEPESADTLDLALGPDYDGEGTAESPFEVQDLEDLQQMRYNLSAHYELTDDIDASDTDSWFDEKGFEPIAGWESDTRDSESDTGGAGESFNGTLDGAGYAISNLTIDRPDTIGVGFIGTTDEGVIQNLRLKSVNVTGEELVGGVAAAVYSDDVTSDTGVLKNVSVTGTVTADGPNAGGLVGHAERANLTNENTFRGSVTGTHEVGGILGRASFSTSVSVTYVQADVTSTGAEGDTSWTADAAGGIVGDSGGRSTFEEIYFNGTVDSAGEHEGAIVGANSEDEDNSDNFYNVYWNEEYAPAEGTGGDSPNDAKNFTSLTTAEMTGADAEDNMAFDWEDTWQPVPSDYPVFQWEAAAAEGDEVATIEASDVTVEPNGEGEITVVASDEFGNEIEGEEISVKDTGELSGLSTEDTESTNESGVATFTFEENAAGEYEVTFSAEDDSITDTATVTVETGDADSVELKTQPDATQTAGETLTGPPEVNVTDQSGNPVSEVDVTVKAIDGDGDLTEGSATTVETDSDGIATFDALVIETADEYRLEFTINDDDENVDSSDSVATNQFDVEPADPADMSVTPETETTTVSDTFGDGNELEYTVTVEDEFDNSVPEVDVELTDDGDDIDVDGDGTQQTDADGNVSFTVQSTVTQEDVAFTFTEQEENNDAVATGTFEAGEATTLEITDAPDSMTAGDNFELTVNATDEFDNPAADQTLENVEASSEHDGEVATEGTLELDRDAEAVLTVEADEVTTADDEHELTVGADDVDSDDTTVAVDSANATAVSVLEHPDATQTAGKAITPNPVVNTTDEFGNPVEGVTVSVEAIDGEGAITAGETTATTDEYGNATFDDLVIETGDEYRLEFAIDDSEETVDSSDEKKTESFDVEPAEVDSVVLDPDEEQTITAGDDIAFNATAYDEFGNTNESTDAEFTWANTTDEGVFDNTTAGTYEVSAELAGVENSTTMTVEPAAVETVELDPSEDQEITAGEEVEFNATAYDEFDNINESADEEFEWTNATETGIFENTTAGTHEVTAELAGVENSTTVTVEPAAVETVELDPSEDQEITAGGTIQFNATAYDEFGNVNESADSEFTWTNTTDENIFENTAAGTYEVSAELAGIENSTTVMVKPAAVETVELDPADDQTITAGETVEFNATAYDEFNNENETVDAEFTWTNASEEGVFDNTSAGTHEVRAELAGVENSTTVTVDPAAVETIELDPSEDQEIVAGETVEFNATAFDEFGNTNESTDEAFTWVNTTDEGVFDNTSAGTHEVSAELAGVENSTTVTVDPAPAHQIVAFDLNTDEIAFGAGEATVNATIEDEYGNRIVDESDVLSLSLEGATESAADSVDNVGTDGDGNATVTVAGDGDLSPTVGDLTVAANLTNEAADATASLTVVPDELEASFASEASQAGEEVDFELALHNDEGDSLEDGDVDSIDIDIELADAPEGYDGEAELEGETFANESATVTIDITEAETTPAFNSTLAGEYDLEATAQPDATADVTDTDSLSIEAADANEVTVETQPKDAVAGEPIAGPPTANVTDEFGNPVPEENVTVKVNGSATLAGETDRETNESGLVEFDDLHITNAGSYELTFELGADSSVAAITDPFDVDPAEPDTLEADDVTETAGFETELTATLTDAFDNPLPEEPLTLTDTDGLEIEDQNQTDDSGNATFAFTEHSTGEYNVTVAVDGDETVNTSATVTIERAAVEDLDLDIDDSEITTAGTTQLTVTATYANETTREVTDAATLTSNATDIATIDDDGVVSGVGDGVANLSAEYYEGENSTTLDVIDESVDASASANTYTPSIRSDGETRDVRFRANASEYPGDDPTFTWRWEEDGTEQTATGEVHETTLSTPETVTVELEVTARGETDTDTMNLTVTDPLSPDARLDAPQNVDIDESFTFDASESTDNVEVAEYTWDFGNGTTVSGADLDTPNGSYSEPGVYDVELIVIDTSGNEDTNTTSVMVRGANATIPDTPLEFGEVGNGSSTSMSIPVENDGTTPLEFTDHELSGENASAFDVTGVTDLVDPEETHRLDVAFTPTEVGKKAAELELETNSTGDDTVTIDLTGVGVESDLTPDESTVGFGDVDVGAQEEREVTIENEGGESATITDVTVGEEAFEVVDAPNEIDAGESEPVTVAFEPETDGAESTTLRVEAENDSTSVSLTGTGLGPEIRLGTDDLEFETTGINTTTTETVEIRNTGSYDLDIEQATVSGSDPEAFSVVSEPDVIGAGESETLELQFGPEDPVEHTGTLTLDHNATAAGAQIVDLSGDAVAADIGMDSTSIDFGVTEAGTSYYETVTISNDGGTNANLTVDDLRIVGSHPDVFDVDSPETPLTIEPGDEQDIVLNLTTDVEEPRRAQLQIRSDAANQPQTNVWLSNERGYIIVQEVSNPTVNIDGTDLKEGSEHLVNVSTSSTQASDVTIDELEMTMEKSDFEMDLSNAKDPFDNELDTDGDTALLQYIELDHISGDPDETFDETAVHYRVDVDAVPVGAAGEDVSLHRYNDSNGEWAELDVQFLEERGGHYHYEVETPGFSEFAITAPEPSGPSPAPSPSPSPSPSPDPDPESNITVTAAMLEEATITEGEAATVTVTLENDGDADGDYTLELTADGTALATESVAVDAGETTNTTLSIAPDAGEYDLELDGQDVGTLVVEPDQADDDGVSDDDDPADDSDEEDVGTADDDGTSSWILLLLGALGGIVLLFVFLWRRREGEDETDGQSSTE